MDRIGVGIAGSVAGTVSLFPPDGSGWYHIDVPGGMGLRFSEKERASRIEILQFPLDPPAAFPISVVLII